METSTQDPPPGYYQGAAAEVVKAAVAGAVAAAPPAKPLAPQQPPPGPGLVPRLESDLDRARGHRKWAILGGVLLSFGCFLFFGGLRVAIDSSFAYGSAKQIMLIVGPCLMAGSLLLFCPPAWYLILVKYKQNGVPYYKILPHDLRRLKDRCRGRARTHVPASRNMELFQQPQQSAFTATVYQTPGQPATTITSVSA